METSSSHPSTLDHATLLFPRLDLWQGEAPGSPRAWPCRSCFLADDSLSTASQPALFKQNKVSVGCTCECGSNWRPEWQLQALRSSEEKGLPRGPPQAKGDPAGGAGSSPLPATSLSRSPSALPCWGTSSCHPVMGPTRPSPTPAGPGSYKRGDKDTYLPPEGVPLDTETSQEALSWLCFPHPCRDLSSSSPLSPLPLASIRAQPTWPPHAFCSLCRSPSTRPAGQTPVQHLRPGRRGGRSTGSAARRKYPSQGSAAAKVEYGAPRGAKA